MRDGLEQLNALPQEEAEAELLKCCGSTLWARRMAEERPFRDLHDLTTKADAEWWALDEEDWLEAFSRHPKIGEKKSERAQAEAARQWSETEQAGATSAGEETRLALAEGNREYERKFGYIYIVCATGKSADQMLAILKGRLQNDADKEIRVAAEEQRRITHLRLQKLLTRESGV
ncbi:MAG TPA: 2-oxo-4-hydroxy-4-carboxy-5-ureidoimidazoline decarboxylase [Pyrinomonadaceae bacterium]|nr:2-oxo-4-hydroxy-4-carboxy-5-ureidoimidazoline decarboxylase [Pyrinomonadaceae bacterium]